MQKTRGNPKWGKPTLLRARNLSISFEKLVSILGLSPDRYVSSMELREWAKKNKDHKNVSLELLKAWGLAVNGRLLSGIGDHLTTQFAVS